MKRTRRIASILTLVLVATLGSGLIEAGVSGRSDSKGEFDGSRLNGGRQTGGDDAWSGDDDRDAGRLLNPRGGANGDLWPVIVDNSVAPHYPWVIWSRFNGANYDLAWSRWKGESWEPVRWVEQNRTAGDDLDPDLAFDALGTPYTAWWREKDEKGQIFISVYLWGHWFKAQSISDPAIDARHPKLTVYGTGKLVIEYETPNGTYLQAAWFQRPVTITDDINPVGLIRLVGGAIVVDRDKQK